MANSTSAVRQFDAAIDVFQARAVAGQGMRQTQGDVGVFGGVMASGVDVDLASSKPICFAPLPQSAS